MATPKEQSDNTRVEFSPKPLTLNVSNPAILQASQSKKQIINRAKNSKEVAEFKRLNPNTKFSDEEIYRGLATGYLVLDDSKETIGPDPYAHQDKETLRKAKIIYTPEDIEKSKQLAEAHNASFFGGMVAPPISQELAERDPSYVNRIISQNAKFLPQTILMGMSTPGIINASSWSIPTIRAANIGLGGNMTIQGVDDIIKNGPTFGNIFETAIGGSFIAPSVISGSWNLVKNGSRNTYNAFNNSIRRIYDNGKLSGQALSDLFQYVRSGKYKDKFTINPQTNQVNWTKEIPEGNVPFVREAISRKHPMNGKFDSFYIDTEKGTIHFNPKLGSTTYTSKLPEQWGGWGETYLATVDGRTSRMVLTSPRVDQGGTNLNLPNTLPKDVIKDFWITGRAVTKPGTYISGDEGIYPIGYYAIQEYKNNGLLKAIKTALYPKTYPHGIRTGLSPDSYSSIIRQAQREGSKLRWGEGFYNWNPSAVENKHISDAFNAFKKGTISLQEYQKIFNEWALPLGGRPLQFTANSQGKTIPIHPHPYIYIKKNGGKFIKWASSTDLGLIKKKSNYEQ